nr:MAG TPA: N-acetyl-beta-D-glucosaminidase N-terminal domain [Caudoviricetes sp.]
MDFFRGLLYIIRQAQRNPLLFSYSRGEKRDF